MNLMNRKYIVAVLISLIVMQEMAGPALAEGLFHRGSGCTCVAYPTQYRQGDLIVEITGPTYNIVEAYFGDLAYRDTFTDIANLHAGRVFLSTGNLGLFAVRHDHDNTVRFVAWDSTTTIIKESSTIPAANFGGSGAIRVAWKTPTVLRLSRYNGNVEKVCLVRWNQGAGEWQYYDEGTKTFEKIM